ncbi:hypothetical protein SAMN05216312_101112 [Cohnella sp. OV330]|uniref:hypothetical protein n=1 Tax=Cohnella sp. OV330 TaxID=1855288 RepID=UPI0008E0B58C|nr:hypothetical protein [Cohnella sp. OV330]SFA72049.1 hypothetical protein SAMN05216312_101112 [Cohnella sp. OV330]
MAQQKWMKWIVGLSGVALFTGFVGLISANGETVSDTTAGQAGSQSGSSIAQGDDQVTDQWQSQTNDGQTNDGQTGGFGRRGGGRFGDMGSGSNGSSGTQSQIPSDSQGSMRTHAS